MRHPAGSGHRRGAALVAIVLVIAVLQLVIIGSLAPARDEADLASLRIETLRAFYAAEAGAHIVVRTTMDRADAPSDEAVLDLAGCETTFVQWPDDEVGIAVVEGTSGRAVRRLQLLLE